MAEAIKWLVISYAGYFCAVLFSLFIKKYVFNRETQRVLIYERRPLEHPFELWLVLLPFFYEYLWSRGFKDKARLKRWHKDEIAGLVKQFNYANLLATIFLMFILFFILYLQVASVTTLFMYFIIFRVISRSSEVMFAFFKDVISPKNTEERNTSLLHTDRIKLAVISYIEMMFLYAILYSLIGQYKIKVLASGVLMSILSIVGDFLDNVLVSFGTITLSDSNLTYFYCDGKFVPLGHVKWFMMLEITTGLVLTIFAITVYLAGIPPKKQK